MVPCDSIIIVLNDREDNTYVLGNEGVMITVGIITVSDRSFQGIRPDTSGPAIHGWAEACGYKVLHVGIVPDEFDEIQKNLIDLSEAGINLILTTGGTGFAPRDITPEVTLAVIDRLAPGIAEIMRLKSFEITSRAVLSRAVSGIRKRSLIINLSGSPKAVLEQLAIIEGIIPHAIELILGEISDCVPSTNETTS